MEKEEIDDINQARNNLYDAISFDENHFENKITVISSSIIALSVTFVLNIKTSYCICLFIVGLIFSVLSLLMNMSLYLIDKNMMRKFIEKFDENISYDKYPDIRPNTQLVLLSKKIDFLNGINLILMIIGILLLLIFIIINLK